VRTNRTVHRGAEGGGQKKQFSEAALRRCSAATEMAAMPYDCQRMRLPWGKPIHHLTELIHPNCKRRPEGRRCLNSLCRASRRAEREGWMPRLFNSAAMPRRTLRRAPAFGDERYLEGLGSLLRPQTQRVIRQS
jgi:hypothetical protein